MLMKRKKHSWTQTELTESRTLTKTIQFKNMTRNYRKSPIYLTYRQKKLVIWERKKFSKTI